MKLWRHLMTTKSPDAVGLLVARTYCMFGLATVLILETVSSLVFENPVERVIFDILQATILLAGSSTAIALLTTRAASAVLGAQDTAVQAHLDVLQRLAVAAELRDGETRYHTYRVGRYSQIIAMELGLEEGFANLLMIAAQLHDIGKLGIPDSVLHKAGALDYHERNEIRQHVEIGGRLLGGSSSPLIQLAETVIWAHHERWDGSGYPRGLAGEQIPIAGRIVAVADVFDALTSTRSYKESWQVQEAIQEIISGRGTEFDPEVVDAFVKCSAQIVPIAEGNFSVEDSLGFTLDDKALEVLWSDADVPRAA